MTRILIALLALLPISARAAGSGCQDTGGSVALEKIRPNATGPQFVGCINRTFEALSSSAVVSGSTSSYSALGWIAVNRISGRSTGSAGIWISSATTFTSSVTVTAPEGLRIVYHADLGSATVRAGLTVVGTTTLQGLVSSLTVSSVTITGAQGLKITSPDASGRSQALRLSRESFGSTYFDTYYNDGTHYGMHIGANTGGAPTFTMNNGNGKVGISTGNPAYQFDVEGEAGFGTGSSKSLFYNGGDLAIATGKRIDTQGPAGYIVSQSSINGSGIFGSGLAISGAGSFSGSLTASSGTFLGGSGGGLLVKDGGVSVTNTNFDGVAVSVVQSNAGDAALRLRQAVSDSTYALQINDAADNVVAHGLYGSGNAFHLGSVGIGTASPCSTCTLHVVGGASVTGAFAVASATFTVATTGIVSAPSQPGARVAVQNSQNLAAGVETRIFWTAAIFNGYNTQDTINLTSSSGTFTARGAGVYLFCSSLRFAGGTTEKNVSLYTNAGRVAMSNATAANTYGTTGVCTTLSMSDGGTAWVTGTSVAADSVYQAEESNAVFQKLW